MKQKNKQRKLTFKKTAISHLLRVAVPEYNNTVPTSGTGFTSRIPTCAKRQ